MDFTQLETRCQSEWTFAPWECWERGGECQECNGATADIVREL